MRSIEGGWLDLAADLLAQPVSTFPCEPLAVHLVTTFGAAGSSFCQIDPTGVLSGGIYPRSEQFHGHRSILEGSVRLNAAPLHANPVLLQYQATGQPTLLQAADVAERFASRRVRAAWRSFAAPAGISEQLAMPLGHDTPSARLRCFVIGRDRAFSATEMVLANRIWRLLIGIDSQAAALQTVSPDTVDVAAALRVTARELAVLRLLAEGLTATAIGRRLAISARTVHKHLEHAYQSLASRTRCPPCSERSDLDC
jgi:DNA-binding CsgD family transcriptional regulator